MRGNLFWEKLGLLYTPEGKFRHEKLLTHAANPLPIHIDADIFRIFYSGRDANNRSSVGAVDIDICKRVIVKDFFEPFFSYGPPNSFFADGVSIGNCYQVSGSIYMLFMGWQAPANGHWRGDIGRLLVSKDLTLTLESETPYVGYDNADPISLSYPWVHRDADGGYRMWYGSTLKWAEGNNEMIHLIKYAYSKNGEVWEKRDEGLPFVPGLAQAFSRPTVIYSDNIGYEMWYSYRGERNSTYRIGYASSRDGENWLLLPNSSGIDVSPLGWDSEMIEYPYVFTHKGMPYMLYNGNNYGKTGFGLARGIIHD
jgi:hypothetical protein